MKKHLYLGVALGALVAASPAMAQSSAPMPAYNWSGFYGGFNVGYSLGNGAANYSEPNFGGGLPIAFTSPSDLNGAIGGFQIGYNWQINNAWVAGLEADFQWASEAARGSFTFQNGEGTGQLGSQILWFGTVRGRVGWLFTPTTMVYATGGLAYGEVNVSGVVDPAGQWAFNQSAVNTGWTVGGGLETNVMNSPYVTLKLEYLYINLGSLSGSGLDAFGTPYTYGASFTDNIFRVGLNFKLSP